MPEDDVTRRTLLASERTYLAWWRTGLTAFAVSLAAGQIVPALTDDPRWPYTVIGAAFALLGIGFTYVAYARERAVGRALRRAATRRRAISCSRASRWSAWCWGSPSCW